MALRGNSSTIWQCLGTLKFASLALSASNNCKGCKSAPGLAKTNATPTSPKSACGTPTTALSATPGRWLNASSISAGYTFNPPLMIKSLLRPTIRTYPLASMLPISPVMKKPSVVNSCAFFSGMRQYPANTFGPLT